VSDDFTNDDKMKITTDGSDKVWTNNSGDMVQLVSKNVISSGTHIIRMKNNNDPGG